MARDYGNRKKAAVQPKPPDVMDEEAVPDDPKDSDEDPPLSDKGDDEGDTDDEELIPMRVPRKTTAVKTAVKTPARSTEEEDRAACTAWYQTFLGVKPNAAEYLYDEEDLDKPSTWVKLNDKTISMIVKGCRDRSIHVSASAVNKMGLLAFLFPLHAP